MILVIDRLQALLRVDEGPARRRVVSLGAALAPLLRRPVLLLLMIRLQAVGKRQPLVLSTFRAVGLLLEV